jgi:hypothetical protein
MPRAVYWPPQSWGAGRHQVGTSCCCCSCSRLGSSCSEKRTEWPGRRPILDEEETGERPEWKHITDRSPTYKSYWAQWKSLALRNDILECRRTVKNGPGRSSFQQSEWRADRTTCWALRRLFRCQARPLLRSGKDTTGFRQETMMRNGAGSAIPVQPVVALEPGIRVKCISMSGHCLKG